jgi:hypothetical protein
MPAPQRAFTDDHIVALHAYRPLADLQSCVFSNRLQKSWQLHRPVNVQ